VVMEGRESMWAPVVSEGVEEDELGLSCDIIIKGQPTVLGGSQGTAFMGDYFQGNDQGIALELTFSSAAGDCSCSPPPPPVADSGSGSGSACDSGEGSSCSGRPFIGMCSTASSTNPY